MDSKALFQSALSVPVVSTVSNVFVQALLKPIEESLVCNGYNISKNFPVLLTDLDRIDCAPALVKSWLGNKKETELLFFRVAVREVEARLLADRIVFSEYTNIVLSKVPKDVEHLIDPKQTLLGIVKKYHALRGDAAGGGEAEGRLGIGKTPGPVHELGDGYVDGAVDVPRRDLAGPEQSDGEGGDVHGGAFEATQGMVGGSHSMLLRTQL